jgi:protein TonB
MSVATMTLELQLPWESSASEDARFRKILRNMLSAFLVFAVVVPFLQVAELTRVEQEELPPHLARVLLEQKVLPKPEVVKPKPKPIVKPKVAEKPKPKPKPKPKLKQDVNQARKVAETSGVLAFQDDLMEMRDSVDLDSLSQTQTRRGEESAQQVERSLITSGVAGSSGGIKTSALSRDTGGAALSSHEATKVSSTIARNTKSRASSGQSANLGGRSDESIRRVMDKNKGAIYSIYNRALRKDPLLQGKLVFEMLIDAGGSVTELKLLSSELSDEALSKKILSRIRLIQFGTEDAHPTRVNYSFDFLPYA